MEDNQHLGANVDTRTPEEAAKADVTIDETVARTSTVDWKEIAPEDVRTFGSQNQTGKSDCVAETRRKLKRIMLKVNHGAEIDFSSVAFYRGRSNFPGGGMIAADAIQLDANGGMTLDVLVPSDVVTSEAGANALVVDPINVGVAVAFRTSQNDVIFANGDLETIASTIQKTRKGVMLWFYATRDEWSQLVPTVQTNLTGPGDPRSYVVHSVTGVEPALYKGQKGIWIDDSAHFGGLDRRFITEEFLKTRNWWASYPMAFRFEGSAVIGKPVHTFNRDLEFSAAFNTDTEVTALQDCLKYDGEFPTNVDSTGYYGALTRKAVGDYQLKHGILTQADVNSPGYGRCGPRTRADLNARFSK